MELYEYFIKICKEINGETSSSTLVEDFASHEKKIIKKLKYFIEIDKLTKELEFKAQKT